MKTLCIIPARAGSKRLPGKNMERVGGLTLVEWAVSRAAGAGLDTLLVTDGKDIAASVFGRCRIKTEPSDLADDATTMARVVSWALRHEINVPERIVLLQPTSPLRSAKDIEACLEIHRRTCCDSVVSVVAKPGHIYERNGAVYVTTPELVRSGLIIGGWTQFYVMPPERSVDIDTMADLEEARRLAGS